MDIDTIARIIGIIGTVIGAASAIAAITPTPKDEKSYARYNSHAEGREILRKVYRIVDLLALNIGKAKDR